MTTPASPLKLLLVAGARPNFMKVAPVVRALAARREVGVAVEFRLVHTGQHYDPAMSEIFFAQLGLPRPDLNLEVGSGSHAVQTAEILKAFEPVCLEYRPHWVVVVGDVNSTLACTLVATKLGIAVAHVEAGLRSFDRTMPEEVNRLVTDAVADLLLTPSADADENLRREGVAEARIVRVGNVMIDTLVQHLEVAREAGRGLRAELGLAAGADFAYVTLHRPANVDSPERLAGIVAALRRLAARLPVVFPVHPRTRARLAELLPKEVPGLLRIEPVGYHQSIGLLDGARLALTDSGGLQEESTFLRVPCLTLRPNTERPVTLTLGSNRLTRLETLDADVEAMLAGPRRRGQVPELWDGRAAERVVDALLAAPLPGAGSAG